MQNDEVRLLYCNYKQKEEFFSKQWRHFDLESIDTLYLEYLKHEYIQITG